MSIIQTAAKLIKDDIMCSDCFLTSDEYPAIEEINLEAVLSSIRMSLRIFLNLVIIRVDKSKKVGFFRSGFDASSQTKIPGDAYADTPWCGASSPICF